MNTLNQAISNIGIVPVIKLSHPERDAAPLARALCAGGVPVAEVTFRAAGADTAIRLMLHHPYRLPRRPEIRSGGAEILPRRAVRRPGQDQGHERPLSAV